MSTTKPTTDVATKPTTDVTTKPTTDSTAKSNDYAGAVAVHIKGAPKQEAVPRRKLGGKRRTKRNLKKKQSRRKHTRKI